MREKWFLIGLTIMVLVSLLGITGCGGKGSVGGSKGSPVEVVEAFYQAVNAGDLQRAEQLSPQRGVDAEAANLVIGNIKNVEIIDKIIAKLPEWEYGYEVWRATITVNVNS